VVKDDGLPGQLAVANGVAGARSHMQSEERGCVTSQHEVGELCLLCGVRPGGAGTATVLLLPHKVGVLWTPAAASFSQLHRSGGHLRPPLRDVHGGTPIGAAVLTLLRAEGYEPSPAAHWRPLLPMPDTWPCPLHRACFPWRPGSSLGNTLLAASLKALTMDQASAELVTPAATCEPLYTNQVVRIALVVIMPTLDDIDIAPVQRGDQSCGVVIPGPGGPGDADGGHGGGDPPAGHGGVPVGGGPTGSCRGAPASGRGGTTGGSSAVAPSKGKLTCVVLDDDEVLSDKDEPL
jgi:hypothetical protein